MKFRSLLLVLYFALAVQAGLDQNTYVPDDSFEQILIELGHDDVLDDSVLTNNINDIFELMIYENHYGLGLEEINDLTGIEDFINLRWLTIEGQNLTELDLSNNTNLEILKCGGNPIDSLDLSSNTELAMLECWGNGMSYLDLRNIAISTNYSEA